LWTVINFSIRESHELSGNQGGQILEKMGAPFLGVYLFRQDCCFPVRAERSPRSCQCSEEAIGVPSTMHRL